MKMKTVVFLLVSMLVVLVASCGEGDEPPAPTASATSTEIAPREASTLEPAPTAVVILEETVVERPECSADGEAPLLEEALRRTGLTRDTFGFRAQDFSEGYHVADEFALQGIWDLLVRPHRVGCFEKKVIGPIDEALETLYPVTGVIRHASGLLGTPIEEDFFLESAYTSGSFDEAIALLCNIVEECGEPEGELSVELAEALAPIIFAIIEGIQARYKMDEEVGTHHTPAWWQENGGNILFPATQETRPDLANQEDRAYLLGKGARRDLYRASASIAFAVESTNLPRFAGRMGAQYTYDLFTSAGWIRIRDGADHEYPNEEKAILFGLDTGGDDLHLDAVASNISAENPVSIDVDLLGDDIRTYRAFHTPYDREGLMPADRYLRSNGDEYDGNISFSEDFRQGAGQNGIAMLFDFGRGKDRYESLRCSQGCAYLGTGGLFDDGGRNIFLCEDGCQGSAQFAISFRIVLGDGNNESHSFTRSQGFGFVQGVAFDISGSGDDISICDHGDPEQGGIPLYYSPQLPGKGNRSYCQGAGMGLWGDQENPEISLTGGLGVKYDLGGNNTFVASVFGLGSGYWGGCGMLNVKGTGNNTFDVRWYGLGGSTHFACGLFFRSGEGEDIFLGNLNVTGVTLGASHDFSLGSFVKEESDATIYVPILSAGASSCNSIGLFVSNGGRDHFIAKSDFGSGMGNKGGCEFPRPTATSTGIMIVVGENEYDYPDSSAFPIPGKGKEWGHARNDCVCEHGSGMDVPEGKTGIYVESIRNQ